jgi:hypothetical protein
MGRRGAGREVGVEDFAKRARLGADLVEVDAENGEDLASGGEG